MTDREAPLSAALGHPDGDTARLVLADFLWTEVRVEQNSARASGRGV
jgi:uncharacterized protein (TIGR02996 family)